MLPAILLRAEHYCVVRAPAQELIPGKGRKRIIVRRPAVPDLPRSLLYNFVNIDCPGIWLVSTPQIRPTLSKGDWCSGKRDKVPIWRPSRIGIPIDTR